MSDFVIGYHGTSIQAAQQILDTGFRLSANWYDWLGDGVYFFERGLAHACRWATQLHHENAAVLQATINLAGCMDLADGSWNETMADFYDQFVAKLKSLDQPIPTQANGANRLQRQVINFAVEALTSNGEQVNSVRQLFLEGRPIYPNSALIEYAHIQIAVRNVDMISEIKVVSHE